MSRTPFSALCHNLHLVNTHRPPRLRETSPRLNIGPQGSGVFSLIRNDGSEVHARRVKHNLRGPASDRVFRATNSSTILFPGKEPSRHRFCIKSPMGDSKICAVASRCIFFPHHPPAVIAGPNVPFTAVAFPDDHILRGLRRQ